MQWNALLCTGVHCIVFQCTAFQCTVLQCKPVADGLYLRRHPVTDRALAPLLVTVHSLLSCDDDDDGDNDEDNDNDDDGDTVYPGH